MNHLLHNLSIRGRLLIILVTFLIPIAILAYELNSRLQDAIDFSENESTGGAYISPLTKLLSNFSDYEMLNIQKLAGETTHDKEIADIIVDIDKTMDQLVEFDKVSAADIDFTPEGLKKHGEVETLTVTNLKKQWDAIKSKPYSETEFGKMQADATTMIKHTGDASGLILDGDLDTYYIVDDILNVFPSLINTLDDIQQHGYKSLNSNGSKLDTKTAIEIENATVSLEEDVLPHAQASLNTALKEDKNFNGISESLQTNMPKKITDFESVGKKTAENLRVLAKGGEMKGADYADSIDLLRNNTSDIAQVSIEELRKMLAVRVVNLKHARLKVMGISGIIIAFAFGLFFLVANSVSRPIQKMTATMGVLANGDTSVDIPSTGNKDEIGGMARAVLVFKENMIKTETMRQEQENMKAEAARQKTITMNQMADDFESSVKTVVTGVSASATQMRGNAERLNALADQTKVTSASVASSATEAAQTATQVAAAAEELTAAIGEISAQVQKSSSVASQATSQAENISQTMHLLVEKSNRVGEVIQFITSIASQINLLALNATIESARAGEAGRGFAVVASEVKNLANQTAKATEEIVQQVQSMQEATQDAVHSVGSIINIIGEISASTNGVAAAVEEQSAATNEISRNIAHTATGTNEISRDIVTVEKGADETGISSRQVLDSAKALSEQSDLLNTKVNDFLKTVRAM